MTKIVNLAIGRDIQEDHLEKATQIFSQVFDASFVKLKEIENWVLLPVGYSSKTFVAFST